MRIGVCKNNLSLIHKCFILILICRISLGKLLMDEVSFCVSMINLCSNRAVSVTPKTYSLYSQLSVWRNTLLNGLQCLQFDQLCSAEKFVSVEAKVKPVLAEPDLKRIIILWKPTLTTTMHFMLESGLFVPTNDSKCCCLLTGIRRLEHSLPVLFSLCRVTELVLKFFLLTCKLSHALYFLTTLYYFAGCEIWLIYLLIWDGLISFMY